MVTNDLHEIIRSHLADLASAANRPFLYNENAFVEAKAEHKLPSQIFMVVDCDLLPSRKDVERTNLFAFDALSIAAKVVPEFLTSNALKIQPPEMAGFPEAVLQTTDSSLAGYRRLISHAMDQLFHIKDDLFVQQAKKIVEERGRSPTWLFRLGPLSDRNLHGSVGELLANGSFEVVVGLDTTRPDLGAIQLFLPVRDAFIRKLSSDNKGFVCTSDIQVTDALREGERTGLFWRHGGDALQARGPGYDVGCCYARLLAGNPPVRLDFVARSGELGPVASAVVAYLARQPVITPEGGLLEKLSDILGSSNVTIPNFAEKLLSDLDGLRALDSRVDKFYKERRAIK